GHASFRLLQFLSAPNVLHDLHAVQDAIGEQRHGDHDRGVTRSSRTRRLLFLFALERGFLDTLLERAIVAPFSTCARFLSRLDQRLCAAVMPAAWMPASRSERD